MINNILEMGDVIYIPTGYSYSGGLTQVIAVENNMILTEFGTFNWNWLKNLQPVLQEIFETQSAEYWY